ncbi:hypothetical protein ABIA39_007025 [Nocardia sp. GAS34]|uniref:hypothetical protein n=1 Tax=unclassified Nocardia TaxID=2637762 RepID=UPI003D22170C
MGRWLAWSWFGVLGPLIGSLSVGGLTGILPHPIYHPVYIVLSSGAWYAGNRLRSTATSSALRRIASVLVAAIVTDIVGQVGQEIAVLGHGGFRAGKQVLTEPFHMTCAVISALAIVLSVVVLAIMSFVAVIRPPSRADGRCGFCIFVSSARRVPCFCASRPAKGPEACSANSLIG